MAVVQELVDFMAEVESVIAEIPGDIQRGISVDSILLNAEWLLRDILLIEDLISPADGEALTAAVTALIVDLQVCARS